MSRATATGFYFEPLTERLALVVEGAPLPTDDAWAFIGDPIEMTPDEARLQCALRWPGVDPDLLHVELDLGLHAMLREIERDQSAAAAPPTIPQAPDISALLAQAEELQRAVAQLGAMNISPDELARQAEEYELARAAAAISASARAGLANKELEESLQRAEATPAEIVTPKVDK
jgi:hypothetical protein